MHPSENKYFPLEIKCRKIFYGAIIITIALSPMTISHASDGENKPAEQSVSIDIALRTAAQCAPLVQYENGARLDASASAYKYAKENPGRVGIPIYPGSDLGNRDPAALGTYFVNSMARRNVLAECFVNDVHVDNGTAINFKINGLTWNEHEFLNFDTASDKKTLDGVAASAKTGAMLLMNSSKGN